MQIIKVTNPAIESFLGEFRNVNTTITECDRCVEIMSLFLAGELSKYLMIRKNVIRTPLGKAEGSIIDEEVILVPVLRAGVAMLSAFQRILPKSKVGFVWAHRDENAVAVMDKYKFPLNRYGEFDLENKTVILLDTMLATGGTINKTIEIIRPYRPKQILCASILATRIGIEAIENNTDILATISDSDTLDSRAYIFPGVGDSGDRLFG